MINYNKSQEKPLQTAAQKRMSQMERDENGLAVLTPDYIQYCCEEAGLYSTPHLNVCLYLHYKGFRAIQGLEAYVNLHSLWLESNCINKISGLDHLDKLKMLYLHNNLITEISGLSNLKNLVTLNISHNHLTKIEGLEHCSSLKQLDISHNLITEMANCEQVKVLPSLTSLDIRDNLINQKDALIPFFQEMPNLLALYVKGNPCIRLVNQFRKFLIQYMPSLAYLDERPITEIERLTADAFVRGGIEEEHRVRDEYNNKKEEATRSNTQKNSIIAEEGRLKRKSAFKKMMAEVQVERQDLIQLHKELKDKYKSIPEGHSDQGFALLKLRKVEEQMKAEWFQKMKLEGEDEIVIQEAMGGKGYKTNKQFTADIEAKYKRDKENQALRQTEAAKDDVFADLQRMEYERRERGTSETVVPQVIPQAQAVNFHPPKQEGGAVSGTSSEDDLKQEEGVEVKDLNQVRWTPRLEMTLEEMLIRNQFDFKATAKEFQRVLNRDEGTNSVVFKIDFKILQLRWTDIEIRRHVMPKMQEDDLENEGVADAQQAQDDEDLPPLEEDPERVTSSKLIKYDSESNSDEDHQEYTNDLEELD